jgi:hypothetical protein
MTNKEYFINSFGEKMELKNDYSKYKDMKDYFLSEIYEFGDTETIFNIRLKKFVDRDSSDGVEAEEIQSDRAFREWNKTGKYKGKYDK